MPFSELTLSVKETSLTAEVAEEEDLMLDTFFVASAKNLKPETTTVSKTNFSRTKNGLCFIVNGQDTLPVSVPAKDVPSTALSQHQPLLQVPQQCLNGQVEYDIDFKVMNTLMEIRL